MKPSRALEHARDLIKQWPHARPPDENGWITSIASVLAEFPPAVVEECCDPRRGLARGREFPPTVACIVEWCENRLKYHQTLANFNGMPAKRIEPHYSDEHRATMLQRLSKLMHDTFDTKPSPQQETTP